jgi:tRNA dimethylallyltransferase
MTEARPNSPILIAGPTAGGKSGLALRLAERFDGVIINADSMQVYRDLRVLTARPSPADEARAPHALYGFVSGAEAYSAGRYAADAALALADARRRGRRPIFVGGTGLYFKTLTEGLSPIPPVEASIREHWRSEAAAKGTAHVHAVLAARDPEMAERLSPGDTQRIVRALEVIDATGTSLAEWQQLPREPVIDAAAAVKIVVAPERDELNRRIDARFEGMMLAGALEEVVHLSALQLDPTLPIMGALGVAPLMRLTRGETPRNKAVQDAATETRQYAKRQLTWARGNMMSWKWLSTQEMESSSAGFVTFID